MVFYYAPIASLSTFIWNIKPFDLYVMSLGNTNYHLIINKLSQPTTFFNFLLSIIFGVGALNIYYSDLYLLFYTAFLLNFDYLASYFYSLLFSTNHAIYWKNWKFLVAGTPWEFCSHEFLRFAKFLLLSKLFYTLLSFKFSAFITKFVSHIYIYIYHLNNCEF